MSIRVSSRIFCLGGEDCVQRSIVCEACKVFEPIFEYQSPMHKKTYKARVSYCQNFLGGKLEGLHLGGKLPPRTPQ